MPESMSWKLNSKLQTGRLGWGAGLGRPAFAPKIEFVEAFQADFTCPVLTEKYFTLPVGQIISTSRAVPPR
jgi:hypothetical protein